MPAHRNGILNQDQNAADFPLEERPSTGNPLFCTVVLKMHNLYEYEITIVKIGESISEKDENYQRELEILKRLRPIDDSLMRCMFRDNIPFSEFFLRTVTRIPDLEIVEMETQRDMKQLAGAHSACLDVYATDAKGTKYDQEVQKAEDGSEPCRLRYYSSAMDIENLKTGQKYRELPETYVIFLMEKDFYHLEKLYYRVERVALEAEQLFGYRAHILILNGEYRDDTEYGMLMHNMFCTDASQMLLKPMADAVGNLKNNLEGVKAMCKELEDYVNQAREEARVETRKEERENFAKKLLEDGTMPLEKIARYTKLTHAKIKELQDQPNEETELQVQLSA